MKLDGIASDPEIEAQRLLSLYDVDHDSTQGGEEIAEQFIWFSNAVSDRWQLLRKYKAWEKKGDQSPEPTFYEESRGMERSAQYALAPCPLINRTLSAAIELSLRKYTPTQLKLILSSIQHREEIAILRNVGIHAEEAMEHEALTLIFRATNHYQARWKAIVHSLYQSKFPTICHNTKCLVDLLEILVSDFPRFVKRQNPTLFLELPFKYFNNYRELVVAELRLLQVPFIMQNRDAPYYYTSTQSFFSSNAILKNILSEKDDDEDARRIVTSYPELFGYKHFEELSFTFVGAGFPLTGIILSIITGANINLIDKDEKAISTARKFISLTNELGITRPGSIKLIHADATEVVYLPSNKIPRDDHKTFIHHSSSSDRIIKKLRFTTTTKEKIVQTDILDLASALPAETTAKVMNENASLVPVVRKRNVRGVSELWYERFIMAKEEEKRGGFKLIGEVSPPQTVVNKATPSNLVVGLTSPININSCQLYANTTNYETKLSSLQRECAEWVKKKHNNNSHHQSQIIVHGDKYLDTKVTKYFQTK